MRAEKIAWFRILLDDKNLNESFSVIIFGHELFTKYYAKARVKVLPELWKVKVK